MKFSGKMILKKILKATKKQGFTPSLENTFLELRLESYTFWPKMSILGDFVSNRWKPISDLKSAPSK